MPALHFEVKADLIVGGQTHTNALPASSQLNSYGGSQQASDFYLHSWIGGVNEDASIEKVHPDGASTVKLDLNDGDVDTIKLEYDFVTPTTNGDRLHHLCSSFIPVKSLLEHLDGKDPKQCYMKGNFTEEDHPSGANQKQCYMKSNFTKDAVLMTFKNISTDVEAIKALKLRPSTLLKQEEINKAVFSMGTTIKQKLLTCDVNNVNAGPQFVDGFTFLPMQGVLTNYGLMGFTFKCLETPINLDCTMYNAYKTLEATGLELGSLASMSDKDLFLHFGAHLATRPTSCAFTTPYSPDLAYDCVGRVSKDTESITRSLSAVALHVQGAVADYKRSEVPIASLQKCIELLAQPDIHDNTKIRGGLSPAMLNDDCENAAQGVCAHMEGVANLARDFDTPERLSRAMAQAAQNNRLFAGFTMEHHKPMAACLHRLGSLVVSGKLQTAFSVVSARGACAEGASADTPPQLSGHGTVIGRLTDSDGVNHFLPLEGTSYIATNHPRDKLLATEITLGLQDGSDMSFDLAKTQTIFAQNLHEIAGLSPHCRMLGQLMSEYPNPVKNSPFYVATFYSALEKDNKTFACVPLDNSTGGTPMFGAPVMGLGSESSIAIPLGPSLMTNSAGRDEQKAFMQLLCDHANEVFPPRANDKQMRALMSHWQPCAPPSDRTLKIDPSRHLRAECTSAFDDPVHTQAAVHVYRQLAAKFNQLQAATPNEDGIRLEGYGTFLSAALKMRIPIPQASTPRIKSTGISNLRAAVTQLGLQGIVTQPSKMAHINSQAKIRSEHAFFMCAQGGGLVHSHAIKLA